MQNIFKIEISLKIIHKYLTNNFSQIKLILRIIFQEIYEILEAFLHISTSQGSYIKLFKFKEKDC